MNRLNTIFWISIFTASLFSQDVYEGYTLYTPQGPIGNNVTTYLVDHNYNTINTWTTNRPVALNAYLLPDSTILYPYTVYAPTMNNGGVGGGFRLMNWGGDILWDATLSNDSYQHHHDIEPLPNGNFLAISYERKTAGEAYAMGRQTINNPLNEMWAEAIFEFQRVGDDELLVVWEWHLWDHLVQDIGNEYPGYGVIDEHPELFNINYGNVGSFQGNPNADWAHFNCVSYNPERDLILITSRFFSEVFVIDHSTTTEEAAGHEGGNYNKGGDFLYRWGNPQTYDTGNISDVQLSGPHGGVWIPEGYPGEGDILIFNNQYAWQNSAVFEIDLPLDGDGNFVLEQGEPYGPDDPVWIYTNSFFSQTQSGAFRLPNGNTLVTASQDRIIMEVNQDDEVVWEYTWGGGGNVFLTRATKYSLDYLIPDIDILLGDINDDETLDILDIVGLVNIILGNQPDHHAADVNGDGNVNILDVITLLNIILA